jgi:hypothetical protein
VKKLIESTCSSGTSVEVDKAQDRIKLSSLISVKRLPFNIGTTCKVYIMTIAGYKIDKTAGVNE